MSIGLFVERRKTNKLKYYKNSLYKEIEVIIVANIDEFYAEIFV